jgi:hypothetical protein
MDVLTSHSAAKQQLPVKKKQIHPFRQFGSTAIDFGKIQKNR